MLKEYSVSIHNKSYDPLNPVLEYSVRGETLSGWLPFGTVKVPDEIKDVESCRAHAERTGYLAYGFRTEKHPDPNARNTCFLYNTKSPDELLKQLDAAGMKQNGDGSHISGCASMGLHFAEGCEGSSMGWYPMGSRTISEDKIQDVMKEDEKDVEAKHCRLYAKKHGHTAFGYRTASHPSDDAKRTCFMYDDKTFPFEKGMVKPMRDPKFHVSACADPSLRFQDGCKSIERKVVTGFSLKQGEEVVGDLEVPGKGTSSSFPKIQLQEGKDLSVLINTSACYKEGCDPTSAKTDKAYSQRSLSMDMHVKQPCAMFGEDYYEKGGSCVKCSEPLQGGSCVKDLFTSKME